MASQLRRLGKNTGMPVTIGDKPSRTFSDYNGDTITTIDTNKQLRKQRRKTLNESIKCAGRRSLYAFTLPMPEQMNATSSGVVTLWEFREYFGLPDDKSTTRLFRCFDEDRDNRIGFLELVVGLWTYCEFFIAAVTNALEIL